MGLTVRGRFTLGAPVEISQVKGGWVDALAQLQWVWCCNAKHDASDVKHLTTPPPTQPERTGGRSNVWRIRCEADFVIIRIAVCDSVSRLGSCFPWVQEKRKMTRIAEVRDSLKNDRASLRPLLLFRVLSFRSVCRQQFTFILVRMRVDTALPAGANQWAVICSGSCGNFADAWPKTHSQYKRQKFPIKMHPTPGPTLHSWRCAEKNPNVTRA